jgi:hypothetical protein
VRSIRATLVATLLGVAVGMLAFASIFALASPSSAHATEYHFCWGKNLSAYPDSCHAGVKRYTYAIYGSTDKGGPICVWNNTNGPKGITCAKHNDEGVYQGELGGELGDPYILNLGPSPTKVYGIVWDGAPGPPPTPPPTPIWNNESLGGNTPSDPDIASWEDHRVDVFARGSNNSLCHRSWDPVFGWSGWEAIPGPNITSGPSAVSWGPGRIDVIARIADNSIEHWGWESGIWSHENLGGNVTSDPDIASWESGRLDVFARGTDNGLFHKSWDPTYKWSGWEKIPGPTITSGPGAVSWGPGRIDVVADVAGGSLQHWSWEKGVWNSENLGGVLISDPDVASWGDHRLDIFARGTDSGLFHESYDPIYKWSGWEKIPGPTITSGPGAVSWGYQRIDVVADVAGNSVQHWSWGTYP